MSLNSILLSGNIHAQLYDSLALKVQITKETNDTGRINLIIRHMMFYGTGGDFYKLSSEIRDLPVEKG